MSPADRASVTHHCQRPIGWIYRVSSPLIEPDSWSRATSLAHTAPRRLLDDIYPGVRVRHSR